MSTLPLIPGHLRAIDEERAHDIAVPDRPPGAEITERIAPHVEAGKISRAEWGIAAAAGALLLVLRWFYAHSDIWNSDEPQHLHVVWAWANGFLPYRDIFDNHTPLFHILSVPLFRALGERPDIVLPMRLAMIPLFAASLWCIYRIGANVFTPRAGLWSAVLLGFYPRFFFMMGQYRTDVLWTVFWLTSLVILTGGPLTKRRLFFAGLALGAAFGVSMKTTLLLALMALAGAVTGIVWRRLAPRQAPVPTTAQRLSLWGAGLAGLLIIPSLILIFFAVKGSLGPLYYCIVEHNTMPGDSTLRRNLHRLCSRESLTLLPALALGATTLPLFAVDPRRAAQQLFLILSAGFFCPVLNGLWRMITSQDYVPWFPLLALVVTPAILLLVKGASRFSPQWAPKLALPILLLVTTGELHWMLRHPIFGRGSTDRMAAIDQALRLTNPGEYVMDPKGDLIFRPRPYYYVLETLTKKRLKRGLLKDDLAQHLIDTRTAVIETTYSRMSPDSIEFVRENYLPVGYLDVLGKMLPIGQDGLAPFELTIPERYFIVAEGGPVTGTLDGQPLDGPRRLSAGPHELHLTSPATRVALIWARAHERGFSPFDPPPPGHVEGDL